MPQVTVFDMTGKSVGEMTLSDAIFGIEPNTSVMHAAVVNYLANQRQGTQSTLTRSEVSGGGRKPWKQKGTGRARQGSTRAPQWTHGGIALGPKPRDYSYELPKKVKRLALKSVLTNCVNENKFIVLDELKFDEIKTKKMQAVLDALNVSKALIVLNENDANVVKSARNIANVQTALTNTINVYDILKYNTVVEKIEEPEDFTFENLRVLHRKYHPERVLLEYNPLWGVNKLRAMKLPLGWGISQEIVIVDGSSYQIYRANMQSLFSEMVQNADMVIFNRCKSSDPLTNYRRGIKVVNPSCDISFEDEDGELIDLFEENTPYDMDAPIIEIEDVDYGIFYVDMDDHPDKYVGKTVKFKARAMKSKNKEAPYFVPGRKAGITTLLLKEINNNGKKLSLTYDAVGNIVV